MIDQVIDTAIVSLSHSLALQMWQNISLNQWWHRSVTLIWNSIYEIPSLHRLVAGLLRTPLCIFVNVLSKTVTSKKY